jgi:hypothetical protein
MRPRGRTDAGPSEACASVCLRGVQVITMPMPRCCRHPSVIRTLPSSSITPVDVVSCAPRLGTPDLWHRPDGRVEVRAGVRLTPAALVQLASACYALRQAGHHPVLRADDAAVREYLWRCAFLEVVRPVARIEPPVPMAIAPPGESEHRASPLLLDVTRLETSADLPPLLDQILRVLQQRLPYRTDDACDVTTAVSELCQNIFDHNVQTCGFVAMQVTGRADHRCLEIGVADDGAGLAATLRRNPHHPPLGSDGEAIQLAVQRGASAYADPTRGTGLYHLLELVAKQAGAVQIRSGTATVHYDRHQRWTGTVPWMAGVHVALTLPTPRGLTDERTGDTLDSMDHG